MSIPGDTLTALSRLSNRRRVQSDGNPEDPYIPDLRGSSADEMPLDIPENLPGETSPQMYDARANELVNTEEDQQSTDLYELGSNLAKLAAQQREEQPQQPLQENLPIMTQQAQSVQQEPMQQPPPMTQAPAPEQAPQQEEPDYSGLWGALKQWWSGPPVAGSHEEFQQNIKDHMEAKDQGIPVEDYRYQKSEQYANDQERFQNEMQEALQEPYSRVVFGATDQVVNNPKLLEEAEKIGVQITPEMAEMTTNMEAALSDMTNEQLQAEGEWNDQIAEMRQRIDQNKATDSDKFLIGLALLMPLIIGGIFGAEAGLGTLAGGAKGMADVYGRRDKNIREDLDRIADLTKQKQTSQLKRKELELEGLAIPGKVKKALGDAPYAHLEGMEMKRYTDEEGNQVEGVQLKPGLVARVDTLADKEDKKEMKTEARDLNKTRSAVNHLANNARRIIDITNKIKDKTFVNKVFQNWSKGKDPTLLSKFGEEIELDGKKVNSAVALAQVLEDTMEARRKVQGIRNFGPQLFEHFERIMTNPYGHFTSVKDLQNQVLTLYTDTRDQFLNDAENRGFLREPLLDDFYKDDVKMYDSMNRKLDRNEAMDIKKELMAEDING